jgi:zinc-ribbon domain
MAKTCPQCQRDVPDDAAFCPACGTAIRAATAATSPPAAASSGPAEHAPNAAATSQSGTPAYNFDATRWSVADRIAGVATIVLLVSLFLPWFGVSVLGITITASGLSAHGWLYIVMIICILEIAYLVLRAGWDELPVTSELPHLVLMMVGTLANLVLVFIAFLDKPGGSGVGWEFGAVLGLVTAAIAAAPYAIPRLRGRTMG